MKIPTTLTSKIVKSLCGLAIAIAGFTTAQAQDTWTGAAGPNWSTLGSWSTGAIPTSSTDVYWASTGANYPTLGTATFDINSLTFLSSTQSNVGYLDGGAGATLIDETGNLTVASGGPSVIIGTVGITPVGPDYPQNVDFVLGDDGTWTAAGQSITVRGAITDEGEGNSITTKGIMTLTLGSSFTGGNSSNFSGGLTLNAGGTVILNSNNAAGTGALTIDDQAGGANYLYVDFGAPTVNNVLTLNGGNYGKFNLFGGYSTQSTWYTTFANTIVGNNGGVGDANFDAGNGTFVFQGGFATTNLGTLTLTSDGAGSTYGGHGTAAGTSTYIFGGGVAGTGGITVSGIEAANLLINNNSTITNQINVQAGGGMTTLGGIQASAVTATYSGFINLAVNSTTPPVANFVSLNSGSTTVFNNLIYDNYTDPVIAINQSFKTSVATAAGADASAITYTTNNPTGTVIFGYSGGNQYGHNGTASTVVYAGTLQVSNTSGSATSLGSVVVNSGASLSGAGFIVPKAGNNVTINGTLTPGITGTNGALHFNLGAGSTLGFGAGSVLALDLGTLSDSVAFNTAGNYLIGSGNATLALTLGTGFSYGNSYNVFTNATTSGFTFAGITGYDTSSYLASVAQSGNNYVLSFAPVPTPEPSAFALFSIGLGLLFLCSVSRLRAKHSV